MAREGNRIGPDDGTGKIRASSNTRVVISCVFLVASMVGVSYAAVPLYRLFCQVTGYGGTTKQVADASGVKPTNRGITVRFDANTAPDLNWNFYPANRSIRLKLGETVKTSYFVENNSDRDLAGTATFNVTPQSMGAYFNKIECFCFTKTVVKAGEKLEMPVVFFVDPEMTEIEEAEGVTTLTLSYSFFPDREAQAALPDDEKTIPARLGSAPVGSADPNESGS